jgi:signal peptidase II
MKRLSLLAFLLIVLGMTGCDHTTKFLISDHLAVGHSQPVITGVLDFRHTLNADTAFSLLGDIIPQPQRLLLLRILAWVAVAVLVSVIVTRWKAAGSWERASWALVLSGALGNAIDRLIRGPVVDFIDVHYWPVFNVADISVSVGLGLLLLIRRDWLFAAPKRA